LVSAALGIVFGDIGTSPLYTLNDRSDLTGAHPNPETILGAPVADPVDARPSLRPVKYVAFAMSIDNDGEGGNPRAHVAHRRSNATSAP